MNPIMRVSETYPTPTLVDGRPVDWLPSSTTVDEWGAFRIEVGAVWDVTYTVTTHELPTVTTPGEDITTVRGATTLIDTLGFAEPYGETVGQITLPGVTEMDEHAGDLAWLADVEGKPVDIWHVLPDTSEVGYWHGFVASVELSSASGLTNAISLQLVGALSGEAALRAHQPLMLDADNDAGTWLGRALDVISYARPLPPFTGFYYESATTGIDLRHRGTRGQSTLEYCDGVLALAQEDDVQWTVSRAYAVDDTYQSRKYYLRGKGEYAAAIQESTVHAGGRGVTLSLSRDYTERFNAVYGEGTDPEDNSRWRNAVYPQLNPTQPTYPGPMASGDVDADFAYDAVTVLQSHLAAGGWGADITGTFDAETVAALNRLYADAGETQSGEITSSGDWDIAWGQSGAVTDLNSGYFRPIAYDHRSDPYTYYSATGGVSGDNDTGPTAYDGRIRVDRAISYGDRIAKTRAQKHAKRLVNQNLEATWTGTVTLTADPIERSRLDIREGGWVVVKGLVGADVPLYVAGVQVSVETVGLPVTLTVASQAFDLLDLATRVQRDRDAKADPAKSFYSLRNRSRHPFRDVVGWDKESGAGLVQPVDLAAGWNVIPVVGAQYGEIAAVDVRTYSPESAFAMAVFGASIDSTVLDGLVADPLAAVGTDGYGWWDVPAIQDDLASYAFIEAWGENGNAAGYWPGSQTVGSAKAAGQVTGRLVDAMSWQFASLDPPYLWLAVWATETCRFRGQVLIVPTET